MQPARTTKPKTRTTPTSLRKTTMTNTTPDQRKERKHPDEIVIGLVSISDRASTGVYEDKGIPALQEWLGAALSSPWQVVTRLIADDAPTISATLIELVDEVGCDLVLTTGGTGPSRRDVTPEATLAVATKEMPGFGEQMRQISLNFVPTAILSRQVAVIREAEQHAALIINLPGQPKSIRETLEGLRDDGAVQVPGIFAAVPYCIDLIGGPYVETNADVVKAFRPKSAQRAPRQD
jgi:molybdopterin adenylyltransferase